MLWYVLLTPKDYRGIQYLGEMNSPVQDPVSLLYLHFSLPFLAAGMAAQSEIIFQILSLGAQVIAFGQLRYE